MRYLFLLVFFMVSLAPAAWAQRSDGPRTGSIQGTVLDAETGDPIITATVALWRTATDELVTGAVTEADGTFRLEGLRPDVYRVQVSFVGYMTQTVDSVAITRDVARANVGVLRMATDAQQMEGVEVVAERAAVSIEIDRTVYNTADSPVTAGGTASEVLETIPSVDVDIDGNVSLRGSGNVAVLINGRPAPVSADAIANYLKTLPAGSVDRVEVMPNPSARYEPDGMGGIINIVLKEEAELGLGGTVVAAGDTQGSVNASSTVTYGRGPLSMAMNYGVRLGQDVGGGTSYRINRFNALRNEPITYFDQEERQNEDETSHFLSLSGDYSLSPQTILNASLQGRTESETEQEITDFLAFSDFDPLLSSTIRDVNESGDSWDADARIGLTHNFESMATRTARASSGSRRSWRGRGGGRGAGNTPGGSGQVGHTLQLEARVSLSANEGAESFLEQVTSGTDILERQEALTDRERDEISLQADYVRPLGGFRFEAGYRGEIETTFSDLYSESADGNAALTPDEGLINTFNFEQVINAVYLQLARQYGSLGVQLGLRGEVAQTTFDLRTTNETNTNDYASLFPSAFLTYKFSEQYQLKGSYSRRVSRPRTRNLNPFPSFDDPLNIRQGNPNLQPEYIDSFELGYVQFTTWGSFTLTPYYRRTTDVVRYFQNLRDDGVTVRTVDNFDTAESSGIELISSLDNISWLDGFRGYASIEGFRLVTDGSNVDSAFQNDAFGWGGRMNASYQFGNLFGFGDLDFQLTVRYRAPIETEQGRRGAFHWTDMALRQDLFNDQASLSLRFRDLLGTAGSINVVDQPDLYNEFFRDWGAQAVGLTFTYSFGEQQRNNRRQRGGGGGGGGGDFGGGGLDE
ncbi:MAG: TonB-dependent receptor [Bacteroidota bacterium]